MRMIAIAVAIIAGRVLNAGYEVIPLKYLTKAKCHRDCALATRCKWFDFKFSL